MNDQDIVEAFISKILKATTVSEVFAALLESVERYGFHSCLITNLPRPDNRPWHDEILVNGWPQAWYERYIAAGHYRFDPCVARCRKHGHSFAWSEIAYGDLDDDARRVMNEAAEFDLLEGMCVPFHDPGLPPAVVTVAGRSVDLVVGGHVVPMLCRHALDTLLRMMSTERCPPTPVLSEREREVLQWTADGKTAWEISRILGLSEHTVSTHLRNSRQKLDGANITNSVVKALGLHEIQP